MSESKTTTLKYYAGMSCGGCSGAITRILKKVDGVEDIKCDVEKKEVTVSGTMDEETVTTKLMKWSKASGKEVKKMD
eukprot:CAMPEP_0197514892 /NCGR_PEP_ID=MMETSP1318-20131121/193_1 /TAXON_ID=552666 /ORGANISM="Partenskyella glossopodia, Strain RCC365" /LENGTH=76 /DNA_ID=CAMNT_0043063111 /DNA_START=101 /DNA_END=331 /DNA_ORIENTATION=+